MSKTFKRQLERQKDGSTLQLLFKAARRLDEEAIARVARSKGAPRLRRSHTSLLPHIDLEGTRVSDLAERLGVTKQAVSQLVDDLEAMGVLRREVDAADARAKRVLFTDKGRATLLEGLGVLRALEAELTERVGTATMAGLREGVLAILSVIDPPSG
ncbi:MAG: winged helix-turn-helix transcriptional regulator [Myxococcales bacterium]|nr:winged helix-turn-helix transcriptional regulator [Myxococcales bacterium]